MSFPSNNSIRYFESSADRKNTPHPGNNIASHSRQGQNSDSIFALNSLVLHSDWPESRGEHGRSTSVSAAGAILACRLLYILYQKAKTLQRTYGLRARFDNHVLLTHAKETVALTVDIYTDFFPIAYQACPEYLNIVNC